MGLLSFRQKRSLCVGQQNLEAERDQRWATWIRAMADGDLEALSALYDESSTVIFGLVLGILRDRVMAEDALVEIYNRARGEAVRFKPRDQKPIDWLIAIARKLAVDRLRCDRPSLSANTKRDLFKHRRQIASIAIAMLSQQERSILEMTYLDGLTAREMADLMEVPIEDVNEKIRAALNKLRTSSRNLSGVIIRMMGED